MSHALMKFDHKKDSVYFGLMMKLVLFELRESEGYLTHFLGSDTFNYKSAGKDSKRNSFVTAALFPFEPEFVDVVGISGIYSFLMSKTLEWDSEMFYNPGFANALLFASICHTNTEFVWELEKLLHNNLARESVDLEVANKFWLNLQVAMDDMLEFSIHFANKEKNTDSFFSSLLTQIQWEHDEFFLGGMRNE